MTKRDRAIIMAYTGGVMFTKDDIQYFLDYVKEKTGIELKVLGWNSAGVPEIYWGPCADEAVEKIRSACKEDFEDLMEKLSEEEYKKGEGKMIFEYGCGRGVFGNDYGMHIKALEEEVTTLRKITQDLRMEIDILKGNKKKPEPEKECKFKQNAKTKSLGAPTLSLDADMDMTCKLLEIFLGRKLNIDELLMLMLLDQIGEPDHHGYEDEKESNKDLLKHMRECCCDNKEG